MLALLATALLVRWPQVGRVMITFEWLPTNGFICTKMNSMKCVLNWISLNMHVSSIKPNPTLKQDILPIGNFKIRPGSPLTSCWELTLQCVNTNWLSHGPGHIVYFGRKHHSGPPWLCLMTVCTKCYAPESTESRTSDSTVSCGTNSKWDFGFI